jgi:hypothetical protein
MPKPVRFPKNGPQSTDDSMSVPGAEHVNQRCAEVQVPPDCAFGPALRRIVGSSGLIPRGQNEEVGR